MTECFAIVDYTIYIVIGTTVVFKYEFIASRALVHIRPVNHTVRNRDNTVNIENLTSRRIISPESGTAIYTMEMKVQVPEKISIAQLEEGLSKVGEALNLNIFIE